MERASTKYKWFKAVTSYTNNSNRFVVIVGANITNAAAGQGADATIITVTLAGDIIDAVRITNISVTGQALLGSPTPTQVSTSGGSITWSSPTVAALPRKILVPPGAIVATTNSTFISAVVCDTIEDALAIL